MKVENPKAVYNEVCKLGGFGYPGANYYPALDITGCDAETRAKIEKLFGNKPKGDK